MKKNVGKIGFWITLALAIASLIAGIIITVMPSNCPVVADGDIKATLSVYPTRTIRFSGSITNESDKDIVVQEMVIMVSTTGKTIKATTDSSFSMQAGETVNLSGITIDADSSTGTPKSVTSVTVKINGITYGIYGNKMPTWAIVMFALAFIFAMMAVSIFLTDRRKKKAEASNKATSQFIIGSTSAPAETAAEENATPAVESGDSVETDAAADTPEEK